jgi:hypothetical protein
LLCKRWNPNQYMHTHRSQKQRGGTTYSEPTLNITTNPIFCPIFTFNDLRHGSGRRRMKKSSAMLKLAPAYVKACASRHFPSTQRSQKAWMGRHWKDTTMTKTSPCRMMTARVILTVMRNQRWGKMRRRKRRRETLVSTCTKT